LGDASSSGDLAREGLVLSPGRLIRASLTGKTLNQHDIRLPQGIAIGGYPVTTAHGWHESYRAAVLETDWTEMQERIQAAEFPIRESERELSENPGGTVEENQAMADAMRSLSILRARCSFVVATSSQRKRLRYPR
jgi:hypothetical protein